MKGNIVEKKLLPHRGHDIECVSYGDWDDPADVCVECVTCGEVLVSAEDFADACISRRDLPEFIGQILDTFEDFLEEKGIVIENPEKGEAVACGEDPEGLAILYGTDYGSLSDEIEKFLVNWGLAEEAI